MSNKVTDAVARARNTFVRGDIVTHDEPAISKADAYHVPEPRLNAAQKAGYAAAEAIAGERFERGILAQERYRKDKAAWQKSQDDALWAKIMASRMVG
jgi:hypothetical protein